MYTCVGGIAIATTDEDAVTVYRNNSIVSIVMVSMLVIVAFSCVVTTMPKVAAELETQIIPLTDTTVNVGASVQLNGLLEPSACATIVGYGFQWNVTSPSGATTSTVVWQSSTSMIYTLTTMAKGQYVVALTGRALTATGEELVGPSTDVRSVYANGIPVTLTAVAPTSVTANQNFAIAGQAVANGTAFTNRTVYLQRSTDDVTWITLASMKTNDTGGYSFVSAETTDGTYFFRTTYPGSSTYDACVSNVVTVTVTGGKTPTALTITAPSTAQADEPFSVTGLLTANGTALTNRTAWLQTVSADTWTNLTSMKTGANGSYSFSRIEAAAGSYQYRVIYPGSPTYGNATSAPVVVAVSGGKTPTRLSIYAPTTVQVNKSFTISGALSAEGRPLANRTVWLQRSDGTNLASVKTDSEGRYAFSRTETVAQWFQYRTYYPGSATYASSTSLPVTVEATTKALTTLTITAPPAAQVNQPFSITGQLTADGARLGNRTVWLQRSDGTNLASLKTDANGTYTFNRTETVAQWFQYRTYYPGSATYASSTSPIVAIEITTKIPTALTISAPMSAQVNQLFTISGQLTANGAPLGNRTVTLYKFVDRDFAPINSQKTVSTGPDAGHYAFSVSESTAAMYRYHVSYGGSSTYLPLQSADRDVEIR